MPDSDIVSDAKQAFQLVRESESDNRAAALDDLKFARLSEQWDPITKQKRDKEARPCLTINRLPAFIRQVVNDARQNKPSIRVHPADSVADPATAEIYNGLIRNIEATSRAGIAYDTALDFAVTMGFGYFRIGTAYAGEDSFDLDLVIDRIANPFSVYGDPDSTAADSSDWNSAFVTERIPRAAFEQRYRDAEPVDWEAEGYESLDAPWREDGDILIAEWWRREATRRTILLLSDQTIVEAKEYAGNRALFDAAGASVVGERQIRSHKVCQYVLTGAEQLEKHEWAGKYIPIIPVYGDEVNVEGRRHFRSLVRDAKDPQKMHNYWRTASTELVALAPKAPFIGPKGAFQSDEKKWETANSDSQAYIEYDVVSANAKAPERQPFAGVPAGALQEALNASDDMKAIIGIHDAGLGARSNETSGRAIMARQREGDVSTFHFNDNLARAIEHGGRVLIDLIPKVYTRDRIVRVLGQEGEPSTIPLGKPVEMKTEQGEAVTRIFDLAAGKYDLTVRTGPSFTSRREEAATQMIELIRAYPAAAPLIGDILARNLDWPGADEIAKRLQLTLPPELRNSSPPPPLAEGRGGMLPPKARSDGGGQGDGVLQLQQLQQELAATKAKLQAAETDRQIELRKLAIDAFKAETERMKVVSESRRAPDPLPFTGGVARGTARDGAGSR